MKPRDLPVYAVRDDLLRALRTSQVVVVEGPTGCGKTTQIPQMLRDSGLLSSGLIIGVTQPRRIAAVSVAHRIAQERGVELGSEVGYTIRFDDRTTSATRIKIMTDGILLQEARTDPDLSRYGVILVDEAHERSLNIDFTLGLLRSLMERRVDLKIVVSSATIYPETFVRFFGGAPRITVPAQTWPVEMRWLPLQDDSRGGRVMGVADVIERIHKREDAGDILAFLPGEAEIKATMTELTWRRLQSVEILPLYGRLTREEQERIFDEFPGRRKIILATNIAETSITIDGVRFIVDLGLAKVPGHDPKTGIESLREQPISQASARQRTGRAGRTGPGICVRLYDRQSFHTRAAFPSEEVLRMDLSEVVLRLIDLGIHDVEAFPFITPPPRRSLIGAVTTLRAMGAIDDERNLTAVGRRMVPFPLPPNLSRMIVCAADHSPDVLFEVISVGSLLSVRWPQVQPPGEEEEARAAHRAFSDPRGDLVAGLRMTAEFERSGDKEAFCKRFYLDLAIMEEILCVRDQLAAIAAEHGVQGGKGGKVDDIIRCVASGLVRNICRGSGTNGQYETATGVRVAIHPGSCLFQRHPRYFVAAEIVATERAWARSVSVLEAEQVIELDPELAHRWQIRARRKPHAPAAAQLPDTLVVGGQELPVRIRRGQACVDVPWELAKGGQPAPQGTSAIRARLLCGEDRFLDGWPLATVLRVAPLLRLDEPEPDAWPEGRILEADRDLWHLLRFVPDLMRVARSRRRSRAAFLTLIPNGAGGYWLDAARDLELCVEQSLMGLTSLGREVGVGPDEEAIIDAARERLELVKQALSGASRS